MEKSKFYELLSVDPYRAHSMVIECGGIDMLHAWVRDIAMRNRMSLVLKPTYAPEVAKWRTLAVMHLRQLVDNSAENALKDPVWDPQEVQGKFEMPTHGRRACVCVRKKTGIRYIRGAAIIRGDKLPAYDYRALSGLKGQYNAAMRDLAHAGNMEFIPLVEWVQSHPDLLEIWERSIARR